MSKYQEELKIGLIDIHGPTPSLKSCSIFEDLAELFQCETSFDAANVLKAEWKFSGKKGKLDVDYESDRVSVLVSKTHIIDLAVVVNKLSGVQVQEEVIFSAKKLVKKWKQPEPFPWNTGDVFYIKLSDGSTAYGQVLDKSSCNSPTCALFSYHTQAPSNNIKAVLDSNAIAILHVQDDHLNDQSWVVIGNAVPNIEPSSGPCGQKGAIGSKDWDGLKSLALAWHGLAPWNKYYKDNYLDEYLLNGISRPQNAIILTRPELEARWVKRPEW